MDFSADCTILTAMISRVQSYAKLKKFPAVLPHLENDTLIIRWNRAKRSDGKVRLFNYDSLFDSDHAIRSGVVPGV